MSVQTIKSTFECAKKNERHHTVAETRYWCDQYRMLAKWAIKLLDKQEQGEQINSTTSMSLTSQNGANYKQEQRCEYCDGTGDVHDQTGEWRGVCVCEAGAKQEQGEPWGACVSGRVFVGALPEHVRKLSEDEELPIQFLYTTPQQRKPLTFERVYELWLARFYTNEYDDVFMNFARAIEAAHGIKADQC